MRYSIDMKKIDKEQIKAVFIDIDGTYYDQLHHCIPTKHIEAVLRLQKKGYKVALASARPFLTFEEVFVCKDVAWDGIVSSGGQEVYDEQYHMLHKSTFNKEELQAIFSIASTHQFPIYAVSDHAFFTTMNDTVRIFKEMFHIHCDIVHAYQNDDIVLITLLMGNNFSYEPYFAHMKNVRIQYTGGVNTDLFPRFVTKASGIHQLMHHWQLPNTAYMAFGDSGSDIEMLQDASLAVAMKNGSMECQQVADYICGSSDQAGIYTFLKHHQFI